MKTKRIYFNGMHCAACATLTQQIIDDIPGIQSKKISHKRGYVDIMIKNTKAEQRFIKAMHHKGYTHSNTPPKASWGIQTMSTQQKRELVSIIILISIIARVMSALGWTEGLMRITGSTSYVTALLTGLVASISTCLAVTGGIVIGFSNYINDNKSDTGRLRAQLSFQGGRILGFFGFGALLGLIGDAITMSLSVTIILSIIVAGLMVYLGGQMLHILPPLSYRGINIPRTRGNTLHTQKHPRVAPIVGALTFFVPCGFTQSMQLIALGSGNRWIGGITMALFALGTAPMLVGVGLGSTWIKNTSRGVAKQIIGVIIIAFGLYTASNTRKLIGRGSYNHGNTLPTAQNVTNTDPVSITVSHNGRQIEDREIIIPSNTPYTLTINPQENGIGCMSSVLIPKAGHRQPQRIIKNTPIIFEGNGLQKGRYPIVCASMGMEMGTIIVK